MIIALDNWCTLPTSMGDFRMYDTGCEKVTIICMGDLENQGENPLFRIHSSCRASEVFGALDCDCADQLKETMKLIATEGRGLVVYQHQEGRGHGLSLKIQAVRLMETDSLDTAEAFEKLGLEQDIRCYSQAVDLLKQLEISSVRLVSNNPRKAGFMQQHGIKTSSVNTHPNVRPENMHYLQTKNNKLGHQLPLESEACSDNIIHFYHSDQPWGELSNFSKHAVFLKGRIWPSVEHFYQAQKFSTFEHQELIRCCATSILAKTRAHELADMHCRPDWINVRDRIMLNGLTAKFEQHPELCNKLLQSGNRYLVELTNKDEYWGDPGDGSGQNRLGHLLMQVRAKLAKTHSTQLLVI